MEAKATAGGRELEANEARRAIEHLTADRGFHQWHHLYASLLIHEGASVREVQARLGHKTPAETMDAYLHLWPDAEDTTRAALERAHRDRTTVGDSAGAATADGGSAPRSPQPSVRRLRPINGDGT